jgi:site-specific DNA-methyltransferase (adenine-specific)
MSNTLYYGDNLAVLREDWVKDGSVDLIYLDPPFNSDATYNILFKKPTGEPSQAQAEAFLDTWTWGPTAATAYGQILENGGKIEPIIKALYSAFGKSDMMAYLVMMGARLEELARKLKPAGSLYLHCDPTASHYLKIILDAIFGPDRFLSEVIWKRTSAHSAALRWGDMSCCRFR